MGSIPNIVKHVISYHCAKFGAFTTKSPILTKFCTNLPDYYLYYLSRASTTRYTCDLYSSSASLGRCKSTYDSLDWIKPFDSLKYEKNVRLPLI